MTLEQLRDWHRQQMRQWEVAEHQRRNPNESNSLDISGDMEAFHWEAIQALDAVIKEHG